MTSIFRWSMKWCMLSIAPRISAVLAWLQLTLRRWHSPVNPQRDGGWELFDTPSVALSLQAEAQHFSLSRFAVTQPIVHVCQRSLLAETFRLAEYRLYAERGSRCWEDLEAEISGSEISHLDSPDWVPDWESLISRLADLTYRLTPTRSMSIVASDS